METLKIALDENGNKIVVLPANGWYYYTTRFAMPVYDNDRYKLIFVSAKAVAFVLLTKLNFIKLTREASYGKGNKVCPNCGRKDENSPASTVFYAAIVAVLCVQRTSEDSFREAFNREVATVIGEICGMLVLAFERNIYCVPYEVLRCLLLSVLLIPIINFSVLIKQEKEFDCREKDNQQAFFLEKFLQRQFNLFDS